MQNRAFILTDTGTPALIFHFIDVISNLGMYGFKYALPWLSTVDPTHTLFI